MTRYHSAARFLVDLAMLTVPSLEARADRALAAKMYSAGQDASDKADYLTAIRAFEESYAAQPHPNTLFALAQAYRQRFLVDRDLDKVKKAIDFYQRFIKAQPRSPWRDTADNYLLELLAIIARQPAASMPVVKAPPPPPTQLMVSSQTPGARVRIDGDPRAEVAPAIRVVKPGSHQVRVTAPGYSAAEREVRALDQRLVVVEVNLESLPGRIRVLSTEDGARVHVDGDPVGTVPFEGGPFSPGSHVVSVGQRGRRTWTQTLNVEPDKTSIAVANMRWSTQRKAATYTAGGGAALAVAAVVTGLFAMQAHSSLDGMPTGTNPERAAYDDRLESRDTLGLTSTVLFIAAGAAISTALGLYWFDYPETAVIRSKAQKVTVGRSSRSYPLSF